MSLQTLASLPPLHIASLLRQYGLRPKKSLGQNFLHDPSVLIKIIRVSGIQADDTVLEIGPGLGSLTRYLALVARQVIAVELDERLLDPLKSVIYGYTNIRLIHADILKLSLIQLLDSSGYLVVANIPYYITSALLRYLLEAPIRPRRLVLTVQNEVAARICAKPGDMSLLALSVQVYGRPVVLTNIPAGAFYPVPKVDSAVVGIDIYHAPLISPPALDSFFRLIKAGFSQKRKTLHNALSAGLGRKKSEIEFLLHAASIDPRRRAETLSLDEWGVLTGVYASRE
jgi:16S rRNA (adenine1518-N6/adenine1519-N6)-dimethyltransferase